MKIKLHMADLPPLPVNTKWGTFKLLVRRPTDQDLLLSEQYAFRREPAARFQLWCECVTGWSELEDEDGNAIPFTTANFKALTQRPEIQKALDDVLFRLFTDSDIGEEQEKNLSPSEAASTEDL